MTTQAIRQAHSFVTRLFAIFSVATSQIFAWKDARIDFSAVLLAGAAGQDGWRRCCVGMASSLDGAGKGLRRRGEITESSNGWGGLNQYDR